MDKVKVSTKITGLAQHKNAGHSHLMTSQALWWLPERMHYGALPLMRQSTSIQFEPALTVSTLSKQVKVTFDF